MVIMSGARAFDLIDHLFIFLSLEICAVWYWFIFYCSTKGCEDICSDRIYMLLIHILVCCCNELCQGNHEADRGDCK